MTGRSLHDALLRVLADSGLRRGLAAGEIGTEEGAVLARADRGRLERLARFMARHYYRERLVRLFRHSGALARRRGVEPFDLIDGPAFAPILDDAVLGSPATAERIASKVEEWFVRIYETRGGPTYWPELIRYEGSMFRTESGRRLWKENPSAPWPPGQPLRRAPSARIVSFDFDLPALVTRLERIAPEDVEPWAVPKAKTRLLMAVSPRGILRVVRCNDALEGFLALVDGQKSADMIVQGCGMDRASAAAALKSLIDIGAVEERR